MKKVKPILAKNAVELAEVLGLSPADALEMEVRRALNDKLIEVVQESGKTHAQIATLAQTSRSRLTAILNRNTSNVSTDLMLRILGTLGYTARIQFRRSSRAA
jgi:predicted XRE-type DNA-binding protein